MQQAHAWAANGTGYEPRSVQVAASAAGSSTRLDLRWGRLAFAQFRDEEFLAKQLRRIEITQAARRVGRSAAGEGAGLTGLTPERTIRQRLLAAQTKATRGASEDEEFDAKEETLLSDLTLKQTTDFEADEKTERELTNALCVLGELEQPELAALMVSKLKEALRRVCTFPNPVYQLIALRRQLMKRMHEAVAAQHRQRKAAVQLSISIVKCIETSLLASSDIAQAPPADAAGLLSGAVPVKPKEKVIREASMGVQVLVCLLDELHDPSVATLAQRREILEDLLPLIRSMGFLALSPRRGLGTNSSGLSPLPIRGSSRGLGPPGPLPGSADIAEFTERMQRFLLDMCPRYTTIPSSSPKLPAISSGNGELDVLDRTNAVNGLIHLAAATGSVRDFLLVLRVLLGASDYGPDAAPKELRSSLSSRSLLTSSVPSLTTVRDDELLPSPISSGREDDEIVRIKLKAKEASVTRPDSSRPQKGSPLSKRETEVLGETGVQDALRRKTLPKGLKTLGANSSSGATTVNIAMSHSSSPHHRLLYSSPGNNLMNKQRTKDELKDAVLLGNASLSLDMSKMKETLTRDNPSPAMMSARGETPVITARCPKFKALNIQSVLVELNRAKPSVPTRGSRGIPTSMYHSSHTGCFSNETSAFAGEDEEGDREVWSCGQNSYGELGHGDTASRKSFERVESLQQKDIIQIGAGNEHTIALTADGKVLTCGYNDNGQCGQGGTARVGYLSEIPKMGDSTISQVHAYNGCEHTILVTVDGRAATCGYNYRGQLGHGNTASESVPKIVRSLENKIVRLVSCSYYHTVMACEEDGSGQQYLYTFGRNDYGQLGHNDLIDRKVPQNVEALSDQHVVSVACGQYHTMVVTASGKAFAFGKNDYGQLGVDSMENQLVPVQVRAGLEKQECLEIRCGYYHTIVLCSGAHLFGFGRNDYGQLGLGRSNSSSTANLQLQQQRFSYARLIEELEGKDIVRFACGCYHTIAVSDNGVMYVFGRNNHGQLGTGDTNERVYPFPIDDFVGKRVALVAAGFYHTVVLTGGKDDEKSDQDAASNERGEASSVPNDVTHTEILSTTTAQAFLNLNAYVELETNPGLVQSLSLNGEAGSGSEAPAIDPTDDDFRDEDSQLKRNTNARMVDGSAIRTPVDSTDALFVVAVILAQLDRLCQPFLPKPGSYSTLQHATMNIIESLEANTASSLASSCDVSCFFEGSFEPFVVHNCSSTFESLAVLLKHLSTKKIETPSQLTSSLVPQLGASPAVSATPRRSSPPTPANRLQMYLLLACIRILQANLSQFLRSGMAKAVILLSPGTNTHKLSSCDAKPWLKELDRTRMAILQVREILLSLVDIKQHRNICYVFDNALNDEEKASRIAEEAIATLMQGIELFFPCQCLQRQFCMHTIHEHPIGEPRNWFCGELCRRDLWFIDTLPKSRGLMLEPLLRRMAEDSLIIRSLPLVSTTHPLTSPGKQLPQESGDSLSSVTEIYQLLLERTATDFGRRLGNVVAVGNLSDVPPRQETTVRTVFETLAGIQKHLSSWAATIHKWSIDDSIDLANTSIGIEALIAQIIDRAFLVDETDLIRVPTAWRCYIDFALTTLGQCCEVLGQVFSMESFPSPTHGYGQHAEFNVNLQDSSLHTRILGVIEHSIVGQFLPLLIVSLFEFSNNSLFAAALLPTLKTLLQLLDRFNQRDGSARDAEKLFVQNVASSVSIRPPQKDNIVSFRRKSDNNLLSLGSARDDDGKSTVSKVLATSDAMALPWHYRLEKELAVLAAEMAVTLVIGDPYFTIDDSNNDYDDGSDAKLSKRWSSSPLFRGGLSSKFLARSINRGTNRHGDSLSKYARTVRHTPFLKAEATLPGLNDQIFSLVLPPLPESHEAVGRWESPTDTTYGELFCPDSVHHFLSPMQNTNGQETSCTAATRLCDWVRDSYAKKDPSYRMIVRQSQLSMNLKSATNFVDRRVVENDVNIEEAFFAALLHHCMLGPQAYHFALTINHSSLETRAPPPRSFLSLWQSVAQLRRRVATKKTEIKNTFNQAAENPKNTSLEQIISLQEMIMDRCKLLLLVDVHEDQEHLSLQLDAGYVAPYDPAFLVSTSSVFKFSTPSVKRHLHATYTDEKLPFLIAFPSSKWRMLRTIMHTVIRWKAISTLCQANRVNALAQVSQEILAYVTSEEDVSSKSAIHSLLIDPCRRVSCSVRGLEFLWELLTLVSFDSIQADIVQQITHVFVFQTPTQSMLRGFQNVGYFYSSLQNEAFSELYGQLTELMTDKASLLMDPGEVDSMPTFCIVIGLLSAWGVHFSAEQFEFISDIGILAIIQEMLQGLPNKCNLGVSGDASPSIPSADSIVGRSGGQPSLVQFIMQKQLARLEDTLWVLLRYIFTHFAVQIVYEEGTNSSLTKEHVYVPTFPVLSGVAELLYSEAFSISNHFSPFSTGMEEAEISKLTEPSPAVTPVAVRRSFEIITVPQRFSAQSKGLTFDYKEMISPSSSDAITPMSPLLKPNEFSVTTWLFINNSFASSTRNVDSPFDSPQALQDRQLVFIRGAAREISLYLVLVPESTDNWQLEVGILMDLNRDTDPGALSGEWTIRGRVWERVLSKQIVSGGTWIHVAVVLEAAKLRLYLNGVLDCQRSLAAQSIPIWSAGNVDLPFYFGKFPTTILGLAQTSTNSVATAAVYTAISFLSRSIGIMKAANWDSGTMTSNNAPAADMVMSKTEAFRCFDGWLSHFRFHNRSLSPIHVRIVFDEKKASPALTVDKTANIHLKAVELHAILILLISSSEGLVHFSSQYSKWIKLVWGTFLGSSSMVVQQSALRVLRDLVPLQHPLVAAEVLIQDSSPKITEMIGFYNLEDILAQQVIRLIGFCLFKCPQGDLSGANANIATVPWTLLVAQGIHANQFSAENRDDINQHKDLQNDIEVKYQSSKRHCLMMANELSQFLQHLLRSSNDAWRQSIVNVVSEIVQDYSSGNARKGNGRHLQFGKRVLDFNALKCMESIGCFYFLSGGIEFLRPGATVEIRGSKDYAQVLSLEYHSSATSRNSPETLSDANAVKHSSSASTTLAYVRIDNNLSGVEVTESCSGGQATEMHNAQKWYDKVFGAQVSTRPTYSKVSIDELYPSEASNPNRKDVYPSILYNLVSQQDYRKVYSVLIEKSSDVLPAVYNDSFFSRNYGILGTDTFEFERDLLSMNVGCMLLKVLVHLSGVNAGVDEMVAKPELINVIAKLAVAEDGNARHETLRDVENRVNVLRREVYAALIELGEEGIAELTNTYDSSCDNSNLSSLKADRAPSSSNEDRMNSLIDTRRRSITPARSDPAIVVAASLSDDANSNWNQAQAGEQDTEINIQDEDDDDDDDGEDQDEDEEGSLEDVENDDDDDDDDDDDEDAEAEAEAEETRAEFVEELMLMGFPEDWCVLALKQTENDIVSASAWIVDNLEYLSKLQSTLDKERDQGRDSPRFNEEEDDVVPLDDAAGDSTLPPSINSFNSWVQSSAWRENDGDAVQSDIHPSTPSASPGVRPCFATCKGDGVTVPPLNDKEMGRKLFGEMYFPFEDGGYLSNNKTRFMHPWRADSIEMNISVAPPKSQPINNSLDETFKEDFQAEINQLDLTGLLGQLRSFEKTLSILYARQCLVTLLLQTTRCKVGSLAHLVISYLQWLKLGKLVILRGNQFTILSGINMTKSVAPQLEEFSVDYVFARAFKYFASCDGSNFATSAFEFCLDELEAATSSKVYEAVLWTQRDLKRPDKTVMEEPGVELVIWLLDVLLTYSASFSLPLSSGFTKTILYRLRCCLGTTNLPLKHVALRAISRLLFALRNSDIGSPRNDLTIESHLEVGAFLTAAVLRHNRELVQGRLLYSQYLQAYLELLHNLQSLAGFSDSSLIQFHVAQSIIGDSCECLSSSSASLLPPTAPTYPKTEGSPLLFDRKRSRSSLLSFAEDGLSVSYSGNEVWKAACAVVGFSTGVHSWMVRIEKSSSPYIFVGVATRQANLDSFLGADDQSWGFIGDKALYYQRNRVRAYGETFTEGDCIGLRLDCEKGELSFSKNGVDLGIAFDNVIGEVCPAVAFYSRHQKISFVRDSCISCSGNGDTKITPTGEDRSASVEDCLIACEIMSNWITNTPMRSAMVMVTSKMTNEWLAGSFKFVTTRSGKSLWVDVRRETCGKLGFYADDRVRTPRGNGVVVGAASGRIWVEVDNEPGTWFFHPSKLRLVTMASSASSTLPTPPIESVQMDLTSTNGNDSSRPTSRQQGTPNNSITDTTSDLVSKPQPPVFTFSPEELTTHGENPLWNIAVDREFVSVINDFCEVSRISPWNLTPNQLLNLVKEKTPVLELTPMASLLSKPQKAIEKMVIARYALLRFTNMYVSRALPFFDLTWHYFSPDSNSLPCRLISLCRGSLFVCVKNALWTALMEKTANSPKRADDEYDYPEDLPQLQVNRLKAAAAKCHEGAVSSLFLSLFGQAFEELHFLPLKTLRMVYSHPMDDGQLRSFKVKFEGEGVDDYGGPYREFFSQFFAELQMLHVPEAEANTSNNTDNSANGGPSSTSLKLDPGVSVSACVLPFLMPSPNWRNGVGANREKFVLNGALIKHPSLDAKQAPGRGRVSTLPGESAEEKRQLYCEMFYFLGQMIGICLRTRVCVRLDLAMSVWKQLVAEDDTNLENALETLKEIDFVAYSLWKTLKGISDDLKLLQTSPESTMSARRHELEEQLEAMDLVFTTVLSDGRTVELCEDGTNSAVTIGNLDKYLDAMLRARIEESKEVMNIVKQGLHSIMPVSALALLTWTELEKRMCGVAEVDVKLLQANTEYDEELSSTDEFIQRFWRVLESLESEDKRAFLRFVWARSRLPLGSAQFHQKFKIQALASSGSGDGGSSSGSTTAAAGGWMDSQMPKSHTCFFALQLPRYSSDEICRERLLYAVRNCVEMDGDFRLADNEMTGWTGIRPTDQLRI